MTANNNNSNINIKDNKFRNLRTSQNAKRKDHSQENKEEIRKSIGSRANLRVLQKDKDTKLKNNLKNINEGLNERETNYSISQSPRGTNVNNFGINYNSSKAQLKNSPKNEKSRSNSRSQMKKNPKLSNNEI